MARRNKSNLVVPQGLKEPETGPGSATCFCRRMDRRIRIEEARQRLHVNDEPKPPATGALRVFSLSPADWEDVENSYGNALESASRVGWNDLARAEALLIQLLQNTTSEQQKWLALGVMVGRASR